uniref:Uncharacterized protein n=1 Tax=Anguilla anguilla TaxID=7936 RepID=A0A0E9V1C0_ANGAN
MCVVHVDNHCKHKKTADVSLCQFFLPMLQKCSGSRAMCVFAGNRLTIKVHSN